jgi:hypothetical protein
MSHTLIALLPEPYMSISSAPAIKDWVIFVIASQLSSCFVVLKFQEVQDASESSFSITLQGYSLRFVIANPLCTGCRNHVLHGVYVKDVMQRQIAPELRKVHKLMPQVYKHMREKGVHVVLAIDNTSRQVFVGITKLEQGCVKLLLPYVKHAQQSPSLAIPICFMEGELLTRAANTRWSIYAEDHLA